MKKNSEWMLGVIAAILVLVIIACVYGLTYNIIRHQQAITCFDYHVNCEEEK